MKLTAKQLRRIISEEASQLNEMFTPIGGIGFGEIPRRPRSDYHDLCLVSETDMDEDCHAAGPSGSHLDFTGDVADLPGEEAFGIGHDAGYEQASADPAQAIVDQLVQSGVNIADVVHKLVAHLSSPS